MTCTYKKNWGKVKAAAKFSFFEDSVKMMSVDSLFCFFPNNEDDDDVVVECGVWSGEIMRRIL